MKLRVVGLVVIAIVAVIVGASVLKSMLNYPSDKTRREFDVKVAFPNLHFNNPVGIYNAARALFKSLVTKFL